MTIMAAIGNGWGDFMLWLQSRQQPRLCWQTLAALGSWPL